MRLLHLDLFVSLPSRRSIIIAQIAKLSNSHSLARIFLVPFELFKLCVESGASVRALVHVAQVDAAALAQAVGVVCGTGVRDAAWGADVGVAQLMREHAEVSEAQLHVVAEDEVVAGFCGALDGGVGLQVEVHEEGRGHYAFDLCARWAVAVSIGLAREGVEASAVALDAHEGGDIDFGTFVEFEAVDCAVQLQFVVCVPECPLDGRKLLALYIEELRIGDAVAIVDDVRRESAISRSTLLFEWRNLLRNPVEDTLFHHKLDMVNDLSMSAQSSSRGSQLSHLFTCLVLQTHGA